MHRVCVAHRFIICSTHLLCSPNYIAIFFFFSFEKTDSRYWCALGDHKIMPQSRFFNDFFLLSVSAHAACVLGTGSRQLRQNRYIGTGTLLYLAST